MPAYPDRKCLWCEKSFPREEITYGNQPAYCSLKCKKASRAHLQETGESKCGRCKGFYTKTYFSQRHCPQCRGQGKCPVCGKQVPERRPTTGKKMYRSEKTFKTPRQHLYCSPKCQAKAWKSKPLPVCTYCGIDVPLPPHVFRNPPKVHYKCQKFPDSPRTTPIPLAVPETYEENEITKYMEKFVDLIRYLRDKDNKDIIKLVEIKDAMNWTSDMARIIMKQWDDKGLVKMVSTAKQRNPRYSTTELFRRLSRPAWLAEQIRQEQEDAGF